MHVACKFRDAQNTACTLSGHMETLSPPLCVRCTCCLYPAAGRLHTAYALMEELANCRKSISNVLPKQPCETLLVLDGTTGLCYQTRGSMCFWFT